MSAMPKRSERALSELRRRIMEGELTGGTRLLEIPLSEMLSISRTPVRQALQHLEEEGFAERVPGGGFVVRSFTEKDINDTLELRGAVEGMAARLAAERGYDPADMLRAEAILDQMDLYLQVPPEKIDTEAFARANLRFHLAVGRLSGSATVQREVERILRLPFASGANYMPAPGQLLRFGRPLDWVQLQHRSILAAIVDGEGTRAEALAREHVRFSRGAAEISMRRQGRGLEGLGVRRDVMEHRAETQLAGR